MRYSAMLASPRFLIAVRPYGRTAALAGWALVSAAWSTVPGREPGSLTALRLLVVGGFLMLGPGAAVVTTLRLDDRLLAGVLAIGISLSALVIGAQLALLLGHWRPTAVIVVLAALTTILALAAPRGPAGRATVRWR